MSVLGSLLFLYFINDLPNISNNFTPVLFADDLALQFESCSIEACNNLCNNELQKIFDWSSANKLSINHGRNKTYYILHTYRTLDIHSLDISINNHNLENLNEAKYLGVIIDSKLKYDKHIAFISEKVSKSIGVIFKLSKLKIPSTVLKQVYYSLIYSMFNYNICSYAGTYVTHTNRLFMLQKRVLRIINNAAYLAHTDILFFENNILKFHDIYKLNIALYMYDTWQSGQFHRTHTYGTRNRNELLPFQARLTVTKNSLRVIGPNIWNSIPPEIQNLTTRSSFKFNFKKYLLSFYNSVL